MSSMTPEKLAVCAEARRLYRKTHPERVAAIDKKSKARPESKARAKKLQAARLEKIKLDPVALEKQREAHRRSYHAHRAKRLVANHKYCDSNREKIRAQGRKYGKANKKRYAENCKKWHKRHPGYYLKKAYGISVSLEEHDRILATQGSVCAICKGTSIGKKLAVDHDHVTGKVRGLLCHRCNLTLGVFNDSTEIFQAMIEYILRHRALAEQVTKQ